MNKTHYVAQPYRSENKTKPTGGMGTFDGDYKSLRTFYTHKFRKLAKFDVRYEILRRGPLGLEHTGEDWMLDRELGWVVLPTAS
jgi:hypothetical protein